MIRHDDLVAMASIGLGAIGGSVLTLAAVTSFSVGDAPPERVAPRPRAVIVEAPAVFDFAIIRDHRRDVVVPPRPASRRGSRPAG
jgi:hypothetical protein